MKMEYAERLTRAASEAGLTLSVEYISFYECEFFHKEQVCLKDGKRYKSLRSLLLDKYPEECVLGLGQERELSKETLTARIAAGKASGFVVLRGGRETRRDCFPSECMGFCHQRTVVGTDELGVFTQCQAYEKCDRNGPATETFLADQAKRPQTLTRRSFHPGGETVDTDYCRFLLTERDLKGYDVAHLLHYAEKHFLTPFFASFLQKRHELRLVPGSEKERNVLKLILNSVYGFCGVEQSNFPTTKIWNESTIARSRDKKLALGSKDLVRLSLLGAVSRSDGPPNLLYAASFHNREAKIHNILQVSACILSKSRVIFLEKVLHLLRCMDPGKMELCYMGEHLPLSLLSFARESSDSLSIADTDSCIMTTHHETLVDNLRPEMVNFFETRAILEDGEAPSEQSGLFKIESVHSAAYFRSLKTYYLLGDMPLVRVRSIPRRDQAALPREVFGPWHNEAVVRSVALRPTGGFEMAIFRESKKLSHSLNLKRKAVVSFIFSVGGGGGGQ
jgi:hypothetical protein